MRDFHNLLAHGLSWSSKKKNYSRVKFRLEVYYPNSLPAVCQSLRASTGMVMSALQFSSTCPAGVYLLTIVTLDAAYDLIYCQRHVHAIIYGSLNGSASSYNI
jgi:hypothetical protein